MNYSRSLSIVCEGGCSKVFEIRDGADVVLALGAEPSPAGRYGPVSINAAAHTAIVLGGWSAFSYADVGGEFDRYMAGGIAHPGRLNRMLLVCPECTSVFTPPMSEKAQQAIAEQSDEKRAVIAAITRLESELATLRQAIAS